PDVLAALDGGSLRKEDTARVDDAVGDGGKITVQLHPLREEEGERGDDDGDERQPAGFVSHGERPHAWGPGALLGPQASDVPVEMTRESRSTGGAHATGMRAGRMLCAGRGR